MSKIHLKTKAVIFDMDGVVTNTMPDHYRAWKRVFAKEGIKVGHMDVYRREGQKGMQSVKEIFAERNKPFSIKRAREILLDKEELFKKIVRKRFIPGARKFLHGLNNKGFLLALVTGTSRHELHRILPDYLYQLFNVTVTGSDVKNGKPHPDPFLKALKKLKIKASQAVVIENSPFGIRSAKKAGLRCLALETSLPKECLREADYHFASYKVMEQRVRLT